MHPFATTRRRVLLRSLAAGACALSGLAARGAIEGKVHYGLSPTGIASRVGNAVLKEIQGRYEPDLGPTLSYVPGESVTRCLEAAHRGIADGTTVLYCSSAHLTLLPLVRTLPILNVVDEFVPVAPLISVAYGFVVGPAVPAEVRTMPQFIAWVRDNPLFANYGVLSLGSAQHMAGMSMARMADLPAKPLPYQSLLSMRREVLQGVVSGAFMPVGGTPELAPEPRLRTLAVTGTRRRQALPEVPTLKELGLGDIEATESIGLHMPAGTPPVKVKQLSDAVQTALQSDAVTALLVGGVQRGVATTPQDYAEELARERLNWRAAVKKEGFNLRG